MSDPTHSSTDDVEIVSVGDSPSAMNNAALTHPKIIRGSDPVDNDSCSLRVTNSLQ